METHMWSDSEVPLNWINTEPASFQTFVSHRIAKIQELTITNQWRHVRSKDNPSDLLSRCIKPNKMKNNSFWWFGPVFLHANEAHWPLIFNKNMVNADHLDRQKCTVGLITNSKSDNLINMIYSIKHNGSFSSLQWIVAYVLRCTVNSRNLNENKQRSISITELYDSLNVIVKAIQESEFADDTKSLSISKTLKPSSPLNGLNPFIDVNGIIKVG